MGEQVKRTDQRAVGDEKRFREAEDSLRKMLEEIAPFVKKREEKRYSSAGKWYEASSCVVAQSGRSQSRQPQ